MANELEGRGTHVAGTIGAIGNTSVFGEGKKVPLHFYKTDTTEVAKATFKEFTVTKKTDIASVDPAFGGGVTVAAGDRNGDGDGDPLSGIRLKVFLAPSDPASHDTSGQDALPAGSIRVEFPPTDDARAANGEYSAISFVGGWGASSYQYAFQGSSAAAAADASSTLLAPKPGPVAYPGPTEVNYGNGNDIIFASDDWEIINGGYGNDVFIAAATAGWFPDLADSWNGGGGLDTASFTNAATAVEVDLLAGTAWRKNGDGWNGKINLSSFENVVGSAHADWIVGTTWDNTLWGHDGNDTIYGNDGDDILYGGLGNDTLHGGWHYDTLYGGDGADALNGDNADDVLYGGAGNDTLNGGEHNDTLYGEAGADTLIGGTGTDEAMYVTNGNVSVNLATGYASGALGADTLFSIENVTTGGGNDTLTGNDENNVLDGNGGHDTLIGGAGNDGLVGRAGNDVLRGGDGDDNLYGGSGADQFRWEIGDLGLDDVGDFVLGEDRVVFGNGFLASADPADALMVFASGSDSLLFADTAEAGWEAIARFDGITQAELEAAIANGVLFGYQVGELGGGGPGGLAGSSLQRGGGGGVADDVVVDGRIITAENFDAGRPGGTADLLFG